MATPEHDLTQMAANLDAARAVVDDFGHAERVAVLANRYPVGALPRPGTRSHAVYRTEILAGISEIVRDLSTAP